MRRSAVLVAIASCGQSAPAPDAPSPRWVYAPPVVAPPVPPALERGRIGRSQAPQPMLASGIVGDAAAGALGPLRRPTPWAVPAPGPARTAISGFLGERRAVDLVEIDAGRLAWRDTATCAAPIVGVTAKSIVCGDANGTRAIAVADGKPRWHNNGGFVALTEGRVVVADERDVVVLDADDGEELWRGAPPRDVEPRAIVASCGDDGRELYARRDGNLVRVVDAPVLGAAIGWEAHLGDIVSVDACSGNTIVVLARPQPAAAATGFAPLVRDGTTFRDARAVDQPASLIALARATGTVVGRIDGVRGFWKARDGSERFEVATSSGVAVWDRGLEGPPAALGLPPLGELIAERDDARLVRASPLTAALLDREGVRAYVALGSRAAALGDVAIVGGTPSGAAGETVHRFGLPRRTRRLLRVPVRRPGVALPAELRDLPAVGELDLTRAIAKPDTARHAVAAAILDPAAQHLYAVALERPPGDAVSAVAAFDVAAGTWTWQRSDACGPGVPVGIAAGSVVACAATGKTASVRATSPDGAAQWTWEPPASGPVVSPSEATDEAAPPELLPVDVLSIDGVQLAGSAVVVHDADRAVVLDGARGRTLGMLTSDDGAPMRAVAVAAGDLTLVVAYERGRIVARLPASLVPVWAVRVDGVVADLAADGGAVLVELDDGDAFRIDVRTLDIAALPGLGLGWRVAGDAIAGVVVGGPIPAPPLPRPPPIPQLDGNGLPLKPDPEAPSIWTPVPIPTPLGDSWQLQLFEQGGGQRVRNDYALAPPIAGPAQVGPRGSPLVVRYGPGAGELLVVDPRTGDPRRRVRLPDGAPGIAFGTVVNGAPLAGTVLANPLRVVLFGPAP